MGFPKSFDQWDLAGGFFNRCTHCRFLPLITDKVEQVAGYVSRGYPFGLMASILFGRYHKAILITVKPKLFIMGTRDEFASVKQPKNKLSLVTGRVESHLIKGVM